MLVIGEDDVGLTGGEFRFLPGRYGDQEAGPGQLEGTLCGWNGVLKQSSDDLRISLAFGRRNDLDETSLDFLVKISDHMKSDDVPSSKHRSASSYARPRQACQCDVRCCVGFQLIVARNLGTNCF